MRDVIKAVLPEQELTPEAIAKRKRSKDRGQSEEGWFAVAKGMGLKFRLPAAAAMRRRLPVPRCLSVA